MKPKIHPISITLLAVATLALIVGLILSANPISTPPDPGRLINWDNGPMWPVVAYVTAAMAFFAALYNEWARRNFK